jgi:glycosyltransferase involved in cell wall biosynthesis
MHSPSKSHLTVEPSAGRISIVVPTYNSERFLAQTIESVMIQSLQDWELLVVDDGSTDSTREIIRSFEIRDSRIRGLFQDNGGVSSARNRGMAASNKSFPYIIFLDSDDIWEPNALELLEKSLIDHPNRVCAHGGVIFIDERGNGIDQGIWGQRCLERPTVVGGRTVSLSLDQPTSFATCVVLCSIPTPGAILIRREAIEQAGEFNEDDPMCQDWDMHVRLARYGDFQFIPQPVIRYRVHANSLSKNRVMQRKMDRLVRLRAIDSPENTLAQRALAIQGFKEAQKLYLQDKWTYFEDAVVKGDFVEMIAQVRAATGVVLNLLRGSP